MDKKIIAFDLDNTLCVGHPYIDAEPLPRMIGIVNQLYDDGYHIVIYTGRGMKTFADQQKATNKYWHLTHSQLMKWKIKHHELIMGKPDFDLLIDDKAINSQCIIDRKDIEKFLDMI